MARSVVMLRKTRSQTETSRGKRNIKMASKKKMPAKKKTITRKSPAKKPGAKKSAPKKSAGKKAAPKKTAARKGKAPARKTQRVAKRPALKRVSTKKRVVTRAAPKPKLADAPIALALAREIAKVAEDKKAADVLIIDTRARASSVGYDYLVIASGDSDRQLTAIQEGVDDLLKARGKRPASVEASPDWVCATWDDGVIAHFFTPDRREQLDLEGLWGTAPRVS
jgi:ribosome silencing factor RsfS/YbeB/iojap